MLQKAKGAISAHLITRLLIVSYFIALALGLIAGVEISKMAEPFMSESAARYVMRFIVLLLAGMVLFGVWRRPAALVLALVVFWTSYISLYSGGEIGSFWRDLALIGGLLLTANIANYADDALAEDLDPPIEPDSTQEMRVTSQNEGGFREDFEFVRAS